MHSQITNRSMHRGSNMPLIRCNIHSWFNCISIILYHHLFRFIFDINKSIQKTYIKFISGTSFCNHNCIHYIRINCARAFEYRQDFQFCWTKYQPGFNLWNLFIVYIPAGFIIIGGMAMSWWSFKRLKLRILDSTFELRWKIIKRQLSIVVCFNINYIIQGILIIVFIFTFCTENTRNTGNIQYKHI